LSTPARCHAAARLAALLQERHQRYVSRLGADNARKLFLTAPENQRRRDAAIGYLTAMAPAEALDEEVDKLATILAPGNRGRSRCAHEAHHQRIRPPANWTKRRRRRHRDSMRGAEIKEGIKAFAGKAGRRNSRLIPQPRIYRSRAECISAGIILR